MRWAGRTQTAVKRECEQKWSPRAGVTRLQAFSDSVCAKSLAEPARNVPDAATSKDGWTRPLHG